MGISRDLPLDKKGGILIVQFGVFRYFKGGVPPPAAAKSAADARQLPSNESTGLFGSNKPIYLDHPSYQGCYKDRKPVRDLPKRYTRFDTTPESCIMECKYQNYKFAGKKLFLY